jgi:hypothetical protein
MLGSALPLFRASAICLGGKWQTGAFIAEARRSGNAENVMLGSVRALSRFRDLPGAEMAVWGFYRGNAERRKRGKRDAWFRASALSRFCDFALTVFRDWPGIFSLCVLGPVWF